VTLKYHYRYNESRYFLDFKSKQFNRSKTLNANMLDLTLKNLKWLSPFEFYGKPYEEIIELRSVKDFIKNKSQSKRVIISDYLLLSSLTNTNTPSPLKFYDSISIPSKKNPFFNYFRNFFIEKLKKENVIFIYTTSPYYEQIVKDIFFDSDCIKLKKITLHLSELHVENCLK